MMKMNTRGSVFDTISGPMSLLVIAITIILAFFIWTSFATNFAPLSDTVDVGDGKTLTDISEEITSSLSYLDYMFPFAVLGLLLVSLIFAFKTGASVIYSYLSIFMWILALLMSVVFEDVFSQFILSFPAISGEFGFIIYIMSNLKYFVLFWAFLISSVMFSRSRQEDTQLASAEKVFMR